MMGNPKLLMPYQPFCDLRLHFSGDRQAVEYHRDLNLENAIADTAYKIGEVSFLRESFVSFPDQVLVIRLTASQPGQLTLSVGMDSPQAGTTVTSSEDGSLHFIGQIQPRQNKPFSWTGSWDQPETRFAAALKVLVDGGSVHSSGDHLNISGATTVTLLFSNATSFKNYRDIGGDPVPLAQGYLDSAVRKSYSQLRQDHVADYSRLFSRVRLQLGPLNPEMARATSRPTNGLPSFRRTKTRACSRSISSSADIYSFLPRGAVASQLTCKASGTTPCFLHGAASGQPTSISR